ncbi:MAG TPA: DUF933 domain-containing protein [Spirochaetota bacterium]|nr:DUF933 domain-containing protein [Spirochaetota bacterium]HPI21881.1 DUF933 domain-containing protein [Spirochaetota bacterium]HPU89481.1 DUF933 domain-containing protein [Spirochaetota bacterium]
MKIGIIGLPQTGKKSFFELLTGAKAPSAPQDQMKALSGIAEVRDERFDRLAALYRPKKETRARIAVDLVPRIDPGSVRPEVLAIAAETDALCHVVRAFEDDAVYHVSGSVNPARDIALVNDELVLHDQLFIEKRLERIAKNQKKGRDERSAREEALLASFREHLDAGRPLRTRAISDEEAALIASYPFLTMKKMIVAVNAGDADIASGCISAAVEEALTESGIACMRISAKLEAEIALLADEAERREFMAASGIAAPALNVLTGLCMDALGLISFFTVGTDEVRQWEVRRGAAAPEAAGAIHSDIQRGFIRAEVMKYPDLIEAGSEDAVKKAGRFHVMGREYIVEDGDIISFRFNV